MTSREHNRYRRDYELYSCSSCEGPEGALLSLFSREEAQTAITSVLGSSKVEPVDKAEAEDPRQTWPSSPSMCALFLS